MQGNNLDQFLNFVNILSFLLQLQNAEAIKIDQFHDEFNHKIEHDVKDKLNEIAKRLDRIEHKIDKLSF